MLNVYLLNASRAGTADRCVQNFIKLDVALRYGRTWLEARGFIVVRGRGWFHRRRPSRDQESWVIVGSLPDELGGTVSAIVSRCCL